MSIDFELFDFPLQNRDNYSMSYFRWIHLCDISISVIHIRRHSLVCHLCVGGIFLKSQKKLMGLKGFSVLLLDNPLLSCYNKNDNTVVYFSKEETRCQKSKMNI